MLTLFNKSQSTPPSHTKKAKIESKSELKLEEWPMLYKKFNIAQKADTTIAKTMRGNPELFLLNPRFWMKN